jgi:general secretion pathway protein G
MSSQRGFSITELLIVVAVIGVIAAIAIPNLMSAVERGRQKRSMADIRSLGQAVEEYMADVNYYPVQTSEDTVENIRATVQPYYTQQLHVQDGWGYDFRYVSDGDGTEYTLKSYGKDGTMSGPVTGPTTNFNDDIVFSLGSFLTYPEGIQND